MSETGFYLFGVDLSHISPDKRIFWHKDYRKIGVSAAEQIDPKAEEGYNEFMDKDGNKATTAGDGDITVITYLTPGEYNPIVTAEANANDVSIMEEQINTERSSGEGPGDSNGVGGCDTGLSVISILVLAGFLQARKKNA